MNSAVFTDLCYVCFGSYQEDTGTERQWLQCKCQRWVTKAVLIMMTPIQVTHSVHFVDFPQTTFHTSISFVLCIRFSYVTGSEKRYIVAHNMIFLYKRCYSKTRNIFYSLKKFFFLLRYLQLFAYTHAKFEELNVLLTGQARNLKTAT